MPVSYTHLDVYKRQVSERPEFGMVAVQGPNARAKVIGLLREEDQTPVSKLVRFSARAAKTNEGVDVFVARTGYTGEDGFEVIVPEAQTVAFWNALLAAGVKPAGLGARDTLRLEAGMNLYGQDMDDTVSPFEAALAWTVAVSYTHLVQAINYFIAQKYIEAFKALAEACLLYTSRCV